MSGLPSFEHTYADAVPELSTPWRAAEVDEPKLLLLNENLAGELGLDVDRLRSPESVAMLAGQVPEGTRTYAQAYAGHQFGSYSPVLGDGRALLLGELVDPAGLRHDLHLKGSGRTPFARGGDGYAAVGPMVREYLMGEAMHALGIPTTRALAVVATGRTIMRERPLPGAVLARVASSHLRVGTFAYTANLGRPDVLRSLADYTIERHHPALREADSPYLALFDAVMRAQAELVAQWMGVGFVHGVMNTDNTTISGETIDYGPCAFLDAHDPRAVFSSIDHSGRYAYGNQPGIIQWNLARLGEALLPLIADVPAGDAAPVHQASIDAAVEAATGVLDAYAGHYEQAVMRVMSAKFGLGDGVGDQESREVVTSGLALLAKESPDHTGFFRGLIDGTARGLVDDPAEFDQWAERRSALVGDESSEQARSAQQMASVNPVYIPRNHVVEESLNAATGGDLAPVERLVAALRRPFEEQPGMEHLARPAPSDAAPHVTYCGT